MPKGGKRPGAGRPKGAPNKLTADIREAINNAFQEVGGTSYLVRVAQEDPKTFCALIAKVIPADVNATLRGDINIRWADE